MDKTDSATQPDLDIVDPWGDRRLEERIAALEAELAECKANLNAKDILLGDLRARLAECRAKLAESAENPPE